MKARNNKIRAYILGATLLLIIVLSGFFIVNVSIKEVDAQTDDSNMRMLLQRLEQGISVSQIDEVFFEFVHPLVGDENRLTSPDIDSEGGYITHTISEIGDDYICFEERIGEIQMKRCTPFTNIASVSYIRR